MGRSSRPCSPGAGAALSGTKLAMIAVDEAHRVPAYMVFNDATLVDCCDCGYVASGKKIIASQGFLDASTT